MKALITTLVIVAAYGGVAAFVAGMHALEKGSLRYMRWMVLAAAAGFICNSIVPIVGFLDWKHNIGISDIIAMLAFFSAADLGIMIALLWRIAREKKLPRAG